MCFVEALADGERDEFTRVSGDYYYRRRSTHTSTPLPRGRHFNVANTCTHTSKVARLNTFYLSICGAKGQWSGRVNPYAKDMRDRFRLVVLAIMEVWHSNLCFPHGKLGGWRDTSQPAQGRIEWSRDIQRGSIRPQGLQTRPGGPSPEATSHKNKSHPLL